MERKGAKMEQESIQSEKLLLNVSNKVDDKSDGCDSDSVGTKCLFDSETCNEVEEEKKSDLYFDDETCTNGKDPANTQQQAVLGPRQYDNLPLDPPVSTPVLYIALKIIPRNVTPNLFVAMAGPGSEDLPLPVVTPDPQAAPVMAEVKVDSEPTPPPPQSMVEQHKARRGKRSKQELREEQQRKEEEEEALKEQRLKEALLAENAREEEVERMMAVGERKRSYHSMRAEESRVPTEEEIEAVPLKRRRVDNPMAHLL